MGTVRVVLAVSCFFWKVPRRVWALYSPFSPGFRCPGVVALTRVCERDLQSVVVAEAFADRRDDGLCKLFAQRLILMCPPRASGLQGLAYHNQRAEAANDQTPENGGLVARSPVDVLAGRGPEGDRGHCGICVCDVCWVVRHLDLRRLDSI